MRDWFQRLLWRDPILRIRCAWHVLQGRPLGYRLTTEPTLFAEADYSWLVDVTARWPESGQPSRPGEGIVVGGRHSKAIRCVVIGNKSASREHHRDTGIRINWGDTPFDALRR